MMHIEKFNCVLEQGFPTWGTSTLGIHLPI